MWDRHFSNISIEIWVQSLNVYGFLGLTGDLGGILVNYIEVGRVMVKDGSDQYSVSV